MLFRSVDEEPSSDYAAVYSGYVSVTPLLMDFTHRTYLETVRGFTPPLEG